MSRNRRFKMLFKSFFCWELLLYRVVCVSIGLPPYSFIIGFSRILRLLRLLLLLLLLLPSPIVLLLQAMPGWRCRWWCDGVVDLLIRITLLLIFLNSWKWLSCKRAKNRKSRAMEEKDENEGNSIFLIFLSFFFSILFFSQSQRLVSNRWIWSCVDFDLIIVRSAIDETIRLRNRWFWVIIRYGIFFMILATL